MPTRAPRSLALPLALLIAAFSTSSAAAQEPPNAFDSATLPGPGTFIYKPQWRYARFADDPTPLGREVHQLTFAQALNVGLAPDWALSLRVPLLQRWETNPRGAEQSFGVGDITTLVKWRIWRHDPKPLDTHRLAIVAGLEWPSGQSEFSSFSIDPIIGLAYTQITGRHGLNAAAAWKFTTDGREYPLLAGEGQADYLRYDAAYLFRIAPTTYTAETLGAWYAVLELNGRYETNGDHEIFLAPGIMYEATTWVFELSVQLPVVRELDHRPETDITVMAGLRFLF